MHEAEHIFMLYDHLDPELLACCGHGFLKGGDVEVVGLDLRQHYHGEKIVHDGLSDVGYVDPLLGHYPAYPGYDSYSVETYDGYNETAG
jgi:hypothetical protein